MSKYTNKGIEIRDINGNENSLINKQNKSNNK